MLLAEVEIRCYIVIGMMGRCVMQKRVYYFTNISVVLVAAFLSGCTSIDGMQKPITTADLGSGICPSPPQIDAFNAPTLTGPAKGQYRDRVIQDCVKAINKNYDAFKTDLQSEAVYSNLIPGIINLGLTGGAALTTGQTAKEFTQGALAAAGIGTLIDKDIFYAQTVPAIEASMDAKRATILKSIIDAEKGDPTGTSYTLYGAGFDLDAYQAAGNIYTAIGELTKTATASAQAAQNEVAQSQAAPYCTTLLDPAIQKRLVGDVRAVMALNSNSPTDRTKLDTLADKLLGSHDPTQIFGDEQERIIIEMNKRVRVCNAVQATAIADVENQISAASIAVPIQ